jgi:hypothetical protein
MTEENRSFIVSIARELWNFELYFEMYDLFDENVTVSEFCREFACFETAEHLPDRAIDFLSSHFFEFDSSFLSGLPISTQITIISNSSFQFSSKNLLYRHIRS